MEEQGRPGEDDEDTTSYLLRAPANARRLKNAYEDALAGRDLVDLSHELKRAELLEQITTEGADLLRRLGEA